MARASNGQKIQTHINGKGEDLFRKLGGRRPSRWEEVMHSDIEHLSFLLRIEFM